MAVWTWYDETVFGSEFTHSTGTKTVTINIPQGESVQRIITSGGVGAATQRQGVDWLGRSPVPIRTGLAIDTSQNNENFVSRMQRSGLATLTGAGYGVLDYGADFASVWAQWQSQASAYEFDARVRFANDSAPGTVRVRFTFEAVIAVSAETFTWTHHPAGTLYVQVLTSK